MRDSDEGEKGGGSRVVRRLSTSHCDATSSGVAISEQIGIPDSDEAGFRSGASSVGLRLVSRLASHLCCVAHRCCATGSQSRQEFQIAMRVRRDSRVVRHVTHCVLLNVSATFAHTRHVDRSGYLSTGRNS